DHHGGVGSVLAPGVRELLDRLDGLGQQLVLPAAQVRARPVAVGPLDVRGAVLRDLGEQSVGAGGLRVVRVDQNRQPCGVLRGHVGSYPPAAAGEPDLEPPRSISAWAPSRITSRPNRNEYCSDDWPAPSRSGLQANR